MGLILYIHKAFSIFEDHCIYTIDIISLWRCIRDALVIHTLFSRVLSSNTVQSWSILTSQSFR